MVKRNEKGRKALLNPLNLLSLKISVIVGFAYALANSERV